MAPPTRIRVSRWLAAPLAGLGLVLVGCSLAERARPAAPETPPPAATALAAPAATALAAPMLRVGPPVSPLPDPNTVPVPAAGTCHISHGLPDPACTPGLLNPDLTAADVCAPGFTTRSIRPPARYTDRLKARLMVAYGLVGNNPNTGRPWTGADVELDHHVALDDLGHPWSPLNLWPEPRRGAGDGPNAEDKDQVEAVVHRLMCADQAHATEYAARMAADWTQFRPSAP